MNILLPYEAWRCANICKASGDVRYYLNGVNIRESIIEATNGHYLYVCNFSKMDFPEGVKRVTSVKGSIIIQPKNKIPLSTRTRNISWVRIKTKDMKCTIEYLSDYMIVEYMDVGDVIHGRFPNTDRVTEPLKDKPLCGSEEIGVNTKYLAMLDKLFGKTSSFPVVRMQVRGPQDAIQFQFKRLNSNITESFTLMPARL